MVRATSVETLEQVYTCTGYGTGAPITLQVKCTCTMLVYVHCMRKAGS